MTTDHARIQKWVESRGATPAAVKTARGGRRGDQTGILRIDFPGYSGAGKLKPISWDEWFDKFDRENLAFLYQDKTARGQRSNFNKIIGRETAQARERGERTSRRAARSR